jgi:hypothetical protein
VPDVAAQNTLELYGTKGALIVHDTISQDPTGKHVQHPSAAGDRLSR